MARRTAIARRPRWLSCATLVLSALPAACGKRGDPLPPLRRVPQPVTDLNVAQRGDRVVVTLLAPRTTTEGQRLPVLDLELLRADTAGDFAKVARAQRLKVAPGESLTRQETLPAAGTSLRFAARATAWGHPSSLTSVVILDVQPVPAAPAALTARMVGTAVALQWTPVIVPPPPSPAAPPSPSPGPPPSPGPSPSPAASPSSSPSPPPSTGVSYWPYRKAKDGAYTRPLSAQPVAEPSHQDAGVQVGETWCYVVRTVAATQPLVESGDSPEACLTIADVLAPASPVGVAAVVRDGAVELSWSPSFESDLAHYRVYRSPIGTDVRERLAELGPGATTYRDAGVTAGAGYTYRLTAVDRAGNESPPSATAEVRLP